MKTVGRPLDRLDGRAKVTGAARFSADTPVADVAHAVIVSSAIAKGRVVKLDLSRAATEPGLLHILTPENAMKLQPAAPDPNSPVDRVLQILQDDLVHYSRQPIALVVADTLEHAVRAAALVAPSYEATTAPVVELEAREGRALAPKPSKPGDEHPGVVSRGDADRALAAAFTRVEATYTTPFETHNPMEPHATVAVWQGDRLTLYDATQGIFEVRRKVSASFGLPKESVRVISHFLGGGFGCKGSVWSHVILAVMAARLLQRPVKLALTRPQMFGLVGGRPRTRQRVSLGASATGAITAIRHDSLSATSTFDEFVEHVTAPTRAVYASPNVSTRERLVRLDIGTPTFMRAPGESSGSFAVESAMDELAVALQLDPLELRLRNHADVDPETGKPWSSKSLKECYRAGAARFGWSRRPREPRTTLEGGALVGWGMATASYPAHLRPASALARFKDDGTVEVLAGSHDLGTGTYTVMTQIASDTLGVAIDKVHFDLGDTEMPETPVSGGSQTAASVGSAVHAAAREARAQLIALALADARSALAGAPADDVVFEDGRLSRKSAPERGEPFEEVLRRAGRRALEARHDAKPSPERERFATRAFGAIFAEVRVDVATGEVRVSRLVGAFACGHILNAKTARSQLIGGMVWGLSMALHERTVLDHRLGRIMNADLAEYHVPVNADVPAVDVILIDEVDPHVNDLGVKGIGEIGTTGVAAAIANAVYHATGKRIRDLPITLDNLL